MIISYNKLWHRLLDLKMTKTELQKKAQLSWGTISKLNRGESVGTGVLLRICTVLDCDIADIMEFEKVVSNEEIE
jgi:putative transcriptional regulator